MIRGSNCPAPAPPFNAARDGVFQNRRAHRREGRVGNGVCAISIARAQDDFFGCGELQTGAINETIFPVQRHDVVNLVAAEKAVDVRVAAVGKLDVEFVKGIAPVDPLHLKHGAQAWLRLPGNPSGYGLRQLGGHRGVVMEVRLERARADVLKLRARVAVGVAVRFKFGLCAIAQADDDFFARPPDDADVAVHAPAFGLQIEQRLEAGQRGMVLKSVRRDKGVAVVFRADGCAQRERVTDFPVRANGGAVGDDFRVVLLESVARGAAQSARCIHKLPVHTRKRLGNHRESERNRNGFEWINNRHLGHGPECLVQFAVRIRPIGKITLRHRADPAELQCDSVRCTQARRIRVQRFESLPVQPDARAAERHCPRTRAIAVDAVGNSCGRQPEEQDEIFQCSQVVHRGDYVGWATPEINREWRLLKCTRARVGEA